MSEKHDEYRDAIDEITENEINYIFIDIDSELDNIESHLDTDSSKILLKWVRDSIDRVAANYKKNKY